ncbi:hypothetical protein ES705_47326 [subsurface metagenome]
MLSGCSSVYSAIITASALAGKGAPVIILAHLFPFIPIFLIVPAVISPATSRAIGLFSDAPNVSFAITANPSIADLLNEGTFLSDITSSAITYPKDLSKGNFTVPIIFILFLSTLITSSKLCLLTKPFIRISFILFF